MRCNYCGKDFDAKEIRSVNVQLNPELKAAVKDGTLFVHECPHCGKAVLSTGAFLYHDPQEHLLIALSATELSAEGLEGYTCRRVATVGELIEKVNIFDAGLDDVVVEMCKYVTRAEMASKAGEEQAAELLRLPMHFYRLEEKDGERYITLSFPDNGRMVGCNIGWNVYEDCRAILERNPSVHPEEGFAKVDAEWLMTLLQ